ncbi:MAG: hypothetical protein CMC57_03755 [Flavobacteriaceae bacterium]|nr:hypothetical protein [Flavobacteriaceae bacterium]|tara:strand:- start:508 stop:1077 length:570 start_codon:yes stop_codon:yes gene_type:complete
MSRLILLSIFFLSCGQSSDKKESKKTKTISEYILKTYVDQSGKSTNENYITHSTYFKGKYSDRIAADQASKATLSFDKENVWFELFKGENKSPFIIEGNNELPFLVRVKDSLGKLHTLNASIYPNKYSKSRVVFHSHKNHDKKFKKLLMENNELIVVFRAQGPMTNYDYGTRFIFTIPRENFTKIIKSL